ncbi:TPA: hypothetical protein HA244_00220 [Candidatus Micrarchaeota archaeon]|nr:hypothetical protein [Candidatus Micrarchaeota archaeon]
MKFLVLAFLLLSTFLLAGCAQSQPQPTSTPTPFPSTLTQPTAIPTPVPTADAIERAIRDKLANATFSQTGMDSIEKAIRAKLG